MPACIRIYGERERDIYIYIYIYRERERERERERSKFGCLRTQNIHVFKAKARI